MAPDCRGYRVGETEVAHAVTENWIWRKDMGCVDVGLLLHDGENMPLTNAIAASQRAGPILPGPAAPTGFR